ncbi:helix-turn-helix domain-containing protein [Actinomycetospora straminea]|uniref:Helix-turn-helix domain-containing protein n=1 Tax=Actinomycetospora straminea TaxID=663607 RepID=A0ABP9E462_9PSEU
MSARVPAPRWPVEKLTVEQVCDELQVARSTFYQWRQLGKAPKCIRLPNGAIRVRRADLDAWLDGCEVPA